MKKHILLSLVLAVALATIFRLVFEPLSVQTVASVEGKSPFVVIDAGHGGIDSGAVADDETYEKDINLSISLKMWDILSVMGYQTLMVRTEDRLIYDDGQNTIRSQKISDLKNRLNLLESTQNSILLSVHQNMFSQKKYKGTQVFYSANNPQSKDFAESVQKSVVSLLQPDNKRMVKASGNEIFLLNNATKPAIMVECGFLSNDAELALLKSNIYQTKMAFSIFCGVNAVI